MSGLNTTEVREWAKAQGIEVKDRGRVPAELVVKFKEDRCKVGWERTPTRQGDGAHSHADVSDLPNAYHALVDMLSQRPVCRSSSSDYGAAL